MTIQKHTIQGGAAAIYGETDNINYFVVEQLTPDSATEVTNVQQSVKTHTRRRFPGDANPSQVPGHPRTVLVDPGRRNGSATPGQQMILVAGGERRQFTYTGPWMQVHSWLVGNVPRQTAAYSASARYDIAPAEAQEQAAKKR